MRVLIAPDKFKGTLTAQQAAKAIARGWRQSRPADQLTMLPISDGGDGFGAVLGELVGARPARLQTVDAAHRPVVATWWWQARTRTAVIESANIVGLAMLPPGQYHPFQLDTFGLGAAFAAAREKKARHIIVGIGGSATNDGGFGFARALGWKFLDAANCEIVNWTKLYRLHHVQPPPKLFPQRLVTVAVDVQNVLLGKQGATRIYGPQKGIRKVDIIPAERCLRRLAQVVRRQFDLRFENFPGAGAAGGLGFGLATFANATFAPGFELFAKQTRLPTLLTKTDLIVTAEGAMDQSTLMGKGAGQIAALGRKRNLQVVGLAGVVHNAASLRRLFALTRALTDLTNPTQARRNAAQWLTRLAADVAKQFPG